MRKETLVTNQKAEAVIAAYRIVKWGAADGDVAQGAAVGDKLIGVANRLGAVAANDRVDVVRAGVAEVEYGGAVTRGDPLTTDAIGKALAAAPAAAVNNHIIGFAEVSGVAGDIGSVLIAPGRIQG